MSKLLPVPTSPPTFLFPLIITFRPGIPIVFNSKLILRVNSFPMACPTNPPVPSKLPPLSRL